MTAAVPDCRDCPWIPRMIEALQEAAGSSAEVAGALRGFTSWWHGFKAEAQAEARAAARQAADEEVARITDEDAARRGHQLALIDRLRPVAVVFLRYVLPPLLTLGLGYGAARVTVLPAETGTTVEVRDVQP